MKITMKRIQSSLNQTCAEGKIDRSKDTKYDVRVNRELLGQIEAPMGMGRTIDKIVRTIAEDPEVKVIVTLHSTGYTPQYKQHTTKTAKPVIAGE